MQTGDSGRARAAEFDLVLFGATGFTGRLVAEYLVQKKPSVRWALAGRSRDKVERVRAELAAIDPAAAELPIVTGDSLDRKAMDAVAARTRVVCTTVGPYARYGSELVAACADRGVDYVDLTGEAPWIRKMIDAHHARAVETGARIVPCCGFDSIPSDLGVLVLHDHAKRAGKQIAEAHLRVLQMKGGASGGTVASMLDIAEHINDPTVRRALADPYVLNPEGEASGPDGGDPMRPSRDRETGRWSAPFVMGTINTRVVRRTNALLGFAYGRSFRYDELLDTGAGPLGLAVALGMSAGIDGFFVVAALPPVRKLMARVLPKPGEGPSREAREHGRFRIEIRAATTDGQKLRARVGADRDPGYAMTSRMIAESALCLIEDELPQRGGLLTPASCMGMTLVDRLRAAGMTFDVESPV